MMLMIYHSNSYKPWLALSLSVYESMYNFSAWLSTFGRANVVTGSDVCISKLELQNLLETIGQFLGPVTKSYVVLF